MWNFLLGWLLGDEVFLKKTTTRMRDIRGATLRLPSEYVRREIGISLQKSNRTTSADPTRPGFLADPVGGMHEEGGVWVETPTGGEQVLHAKPGSLSTLGVDATAHVDVTDFIPTPAVKQGGDFKGTFHIHPSGVKGETTEGSSSSSTTPGRTSTFRGGESTKHYYEQPPSAADLRNAAQAAQSSPTIEMNIVVGARSKYVYFYTPASPADKGYTAKFSLSKFLDTRRVRSR